MAGWMAGKAAEKKSASNITRLVPVQTSKQGVLMSIADPLRAKAKEVGEGGDVEDAKLVQRTINRHCAVQHILILVKVFLSHGTGRGPVRRGVKYV